MKEDITIQLEDKSVISGSIFFIEMKNTDYGLRLCAEGIDEISSGTDYFDSFSNIRKKLAEQNIYPLCYGASKNIWPSGMLRDMQDGLIAYKMVLGKDAKEMVDIFEYGDDIECVHPNKQEEFFLQWCDSIEDK